MNIDLYTFLLGLAVMAWFITREVKSTEIIKDLSTKIMAKDIQEYREMTMTPEDEQKAAAKDEDRVDLSDSPIWDDPEEFKKAIEGGLKGK